MRELEVFQNGFVSAQTPYVGSDGKIVGNNGAIGLTGAAALTIPALQTVRQKKYGKTGRIGTTGWVAGLK